MAIFHLSMKALGRKTDRSAVAAAAYRAGEYLVDERSGVVHDYRRKRCHASGVVLPGGGTAGRGEFWNAVEKHHKRGDAITAREIEVSLPHELSLAGMQKLAAAYAAELSDKYGVGVDWAIHAPSRKGPVEFDEDGPDRRNWHVHILLSACSVSSAGELGKKVEALDPIACSRAKGGPKPNPADVERPRWAELANAALAAEGRRERIDHRSLAAQREAVLDVIEAAAEQGLEIRPALLDRAAALHREPGMHLGPARWAARRRPSDEAPEKVEREAQIWAGNASKIQAARHQLQAWWEELWAWWKARRVSEQGAEDRQGYEPDLGPARSGSGGLVPGMSM